LAAALVFLEFRGFRASPGAVSLAFRDYPAYQVTPANLEFRANQVNQGFRAIPEFPARQVFPAYPVFLVLRGSPAFRGFPESERSRTHLRSVQPPLSVRKFF
jgi:hypothetical protein